METTKLEAAARSVEQTQGFKFVLDSWTWHLEWCQACGAECAVLGHASVVNEGAADDGGDTTECRISRRECGKLKPTPLGSVVTVKPLKRVSCSISRSTSLMPLLRFVFEFLGECHQYSHHLQHQQHALKGEGCDCRTDMPHRHLRTRAFGVVPGRHAVLQVRSARAVWYGTT